MYYIIDSVFNRLSSDELSRPGSPISISSISSSHQRKQSSLSNDNDGRSFTSNGESSGFTDQLSHGIYTCTCIHSYIHTYICMYIYVRKFQY